MEEQLTPDNFLQYAMNHYTNRHCLSVEDFKEDLNKFQSLKKLFSRYRNRDELRERLMLNYVIVIYNVWEHHAATRMLFYKFGSDYPSYLATVLTFLGYLPATLNTLNTSDIPLDKGIIDALRKI